jgi:hypothetical protein
LRMPSFIASGLLRMKAISSMKFSLESRPAG